MGEEEKRRRDVGKVKENIEEKKLLKGKVKIKGKGKNVGKGKTKGRKVEREGKR